MTRAQTKQRPHTPSPSLVKSRSATVRGLFPEVTPATTETEQDPVSISMSVAEPASGMILLETVSDPVHSGFDEAGDVSVDVGNEEGFVEVNVNLRSSTPPPSLSLRVSACVW